MICISRSRIFRIGSNTAREDYCSATLADKASIDYVKQTIPRVVSRGDQYVYHAVH